MRIRSTGLTLFAGLSILVAACSSSTASTAPSAAAPSTAASAAAPSTAASTAPSEAPSVKPTSDLKIGVVTDVGKVNDKNFNQFSYAGAVNGAVSIGAKTPSVVVPTAPSDYEPDLQAYVDQGYNIIVAVGFNLVAPTAKLAKLNPDIWFIGVDHNPCIDAKGDISPDFSDCSGDLSKLIPNYIAINYQEDQAGYLAGIVAASASKSGIIGAVGGVAVCGPCVRYIQGFYLGAQSVNPAIKMKSAWVSASDFVKGFADQAGGTAYGEQFIKLNPGIDVVFQVAGLDRQRRHRRRLRGGHRRNRRRRRPARVLRGLAEVHPDERREAPRHVGLELDPADRAQDGQGRHRHLQRRQRRDRRLAVLRRGEQAPGRHPDQDRCGARRHEGRLRRHLPAGPRLREDPGSADRQLAQTQSHMSGSVLTADPLVVSST